MILEAFNEAYRAAEHNIKAAFDANNPDDEELRRHVNHLKHVIDSADLALRASGKTNEPTILAARKNLESFKREMLAQQLHKQVPMNQHSKALALSRDSSKKLLEQSLRNALESEQHGQSAAVNLQMQRACIDRSHQNLSRVKQSLDESEGALNTVKRWWSSR